ncbi:MAG: tripartite tricarboxylate transporter substrate binding protein [Candidatus Parcubacteria bacterium]|nr:tripartite tricarboxylate transporter substrate binding protein [Burkholderiales bacterium]
MKVLISMLGLLLAAAATQAQTFPQPGKPIRVLVGFAAGGGTDIQARIVAPRLAEALGASVVVENKPGAGTSIAAAEVAKAAPDGHTILYSFNGAFAQVPYTLAGGVPYDPVKDFTGLSLGASGSQILVLHVSVPASNIRELLVWAKSNPGQLNIASFGTGTSSHLFAEMFMRQSGVEMVHVPYKGTGDAVKDLLAGRVQIMFDAGTSAIANAATGRLKMIAVVGEKRSPFTPEVPTLTEQGIKGIDLVGWLGWFGPANMPPEITKKLNAALMRAHANPEVKTAFEKGGYESVSSSPEALGAMVKRDIDRWGRIIKDIGFKPQ